MNDPRLLAVMLAVVSIFLLRSLLNPPAGAAPAGDVDLDLEKTGAVVWSSPAEDCYCTCRRALP